VEEFEEQFDVYPVDDQVHIEVNEVLVLEHEPSQQYVPLEKNIIISERNSLTRKSHQLFTHSDQLKSD
jgi:hypothetical protein